MIWSFFFVFPFFFVVVVRLIQFNSFRSFFLCVHVCVCLVMIIKFFFFSFRFISFLFHSLFNCQFLHSIYYDIYINIYKFNWLVVPIQWWWCLVITIRYIHYITLSFNGFLYCYPCIHILTDWLCCLYSLFIIIDFIMMIIFVFFIVQKILPSRLEFQTSRKK